MMGLVVLSYMSSGPMPKTLAMAVLGLLLGMIGIDPMSGYNRFSGGVHELSDGLGVLPLAVGLFGVSEIMLAYGTRALQPIKPRFSELLPSRAEARASVGPIGRGTVIGFLIGIIPGSAHILSSFVSYAVEKKLSDHPERFGKGAVEGVAGPESANNAAACGAFVPMLALGVPLGPVQAILIAVLVVHGIAPGPLMISGPGGDAVHHQHRDQDRQQRPRGRPAPASARRRRRPPSCWRLPGPATPSTAPFPNSSGRRRACCSTA